ncbi:uncharacterized protein BT62DRAFT_1006505 [Guyanagaster necrorhizus]|uniref:DUF6533 domain-containing protein n=1 Tax=Guyanagaster necrorhizus TaxID=856835 RepID=A0A9P7VT07_9AGAR|nr:uncharacterized protein BT62DRAFT_1006505 [Guyanagaster necrorhizus MCA 3950]KAG7445529.1 hypothetical protein BT62DRAFT_1006505 [Guyanagaster necrorhizus MCA 3950]
MVLMLWDHCLTFGEEVATMWGPLNERILTKVVHILNRYFTEAVLIYRLYATSELGRSPDSNVNVRYTGFLREVTHNIRADVKQWFGLLTNLLLSLHHDARLSPLGSQAVCSQDVARCIRYLHNSLNDSIDPVGPELLEDRRQISTESQNICDIERIPPTVPCSVGVLLLFDVFVIVITIYNSLEKPRRSESELLDSLMCDGARNYLAVCILWLLILVSSVTINAAVFFSLFTLVCSLNANIAARVHLRVEGLRLIVPTRSITIYRGSAEIWHS